MWPIMGNICERAQGNLWGLYKESLWEPNNMENIWVIFMWAQNNLWACVDIFVSGLTKLRPENLYLNKFKKQKIHLYYKIVTITSHL